MTLNEDGRPIEQDEVVRESPDDFDDLHRADARRAEREVRHHSTEAALALKDLAESLEDLTPEERELWWKVNASELAELRAEIEQLDAAIDAHEAGRLFGLALAGLSVEVPLPAAVIDALFAEFEKRIRADLLEGFRNASEQEFLTVKEAAAFARVTENRIHKLRSEGKLDSNVGVGGTALVRTAQLRNLIENNESKRGRRV